MTRTNILCFAPELAAVIGLNEAIVLQQIHYWTGINKAQNVNFHDGHYWVFQTYKEWNEQFPFWSERTIERIFHSLETKGYIITGCYNRMKYDRTKWYTIPYDTLTDSIIRFLSHTVSFSANIETERTDTSRQDEQGDSDRITSPIQENNKKNNKDENGLSPTLSSDNSFYKDDKTELISDFIRLYYTYYAVTKGEPHPRLKEDQLGRIRLVLGDFIQAYHLDLYELRLMMKQFFECSIESDHNINHFATEKVLEYRYREAVYRESPLLRDEY